jgi:hypothetical protein
VLDDGTDGSSRSSRQSALRCQFTGSLEDDTLAVDHDATKGSANEGERSWATASGRRRRHLHRLHLGRGGRDVVLFKVPTTLPTSPRRDGGIAAIAGEGTTARPARATT